MGDDVEGLQVKIELIMWIRFIRGIEGSNFIRDVDIDRLICHPPWTAVTY